MSSSTPYKSRLLNFLNRQAIQINDKLGETIRYIKVATEWGVQILLYPVYLMVQSGRMAGKQLAQKLQTNLFLSSGTETRENREEIPIDRPLEAILITLSPWLTATKINDSATDISATESIAVAVNSNPKKTNNLNLTTPEKKSLLNPDLSFQGIASSIENRHLVLVDKDNQTLDILSAEQQQQIQKQIVLEVAVYKYQKRRKAMLDKQQEMAYLPSYEINSNANNTAAPVRLLWETMNWMQTSQLATSLDLFGESNLVCPTPIHPSKNQINNIISTIDLTEIANSLDGTLVKLEDGTILPLSNKIGEQLQAIGKDWQNSLQYQARSKEIEIDPFQIKAIILAAIEYFFGNRSDRVIASKKTPQIKASIDEIEEDPWLTWEDLYLSERSRSTVKSKMPIQSTPSPSLSAATMPRKPNDSAANKIKKDIERQKARSIQPIPRKSSKLVKKTLSTSNIVSQKKVDRQNSSLQTNRDYLETEAKPVGYVKHPLEQILVWLDKTILWLEELFLAIVRWLNR
jgi:hypothetical protein